MNAFLLTKEADHSLSPVMHNAAFTALGLDARYEALGLAEAELPGVAKQLRDPHVYGANITIPYKVTVISLLDALSPEAEAVGAVNTILNQNGTLVGHNTDVSGFTRALSEDGDYHAEGQKVVMLGAGGAARAVGLALLRAGATLGISNRTFATAEALAYDLKSYGNVAAIGLEDLERTVQKASLVVNTTSVGHQTNDPDSSPLPPGILPREMVVDIIYRPAETPLLRAAAAAGLKTQNGLAMLVYQGAEAFSAWTGRDAPIEVMFKALRGGLE